KYSWSRPGLMSVNGRIATDAAGGGTAVAGTDAAAPATGSAGAADGSPAGRMRSRRCGVTSKAQARAQASGNPTAAATISSLRDQAGSPSGSNTASATWIASQAATR